MEFLKPNLYNTTSSIAVDSSTDRAQYLFDRDVRFQYVSSGYNGTTSTTIRVNFSETITVSRVAILEHNLKDFRVYYNGVTANTLALSGGHTTASNWASNSETSMYLRATPVACTSLSIQMNNTILGGVEKAIGYLVISDVLASISRPPSAKNYKPKRDPQDVTHTLSDGGTRIQNISDKFTMNVKYQFLPAADRDSLESIWSLHQEMIFCPFGTTTSWDAVIFPCVWTGDFNGNEFSDDAPDAGYNVTIALKETPR